MSKRDELLIVTPGVPGDYDPPRHNHVRKLQRLLAEGKLAVKPGALQGLEVLHDDWCALLTRGGYCNCDPIIEVRP
jgi:hypothetical protein